MSQLQGPTNILLYLKRLLKMLESLTVVDSSQRQRVVVDSVATVSSATLAASQSIYLYSGSPSSSAYATPAAVPPVGIQYGGVVHEVNFPVDQRWEMIDRSRINFTLTCRGKIS